MPPVIHKFNRPGMNDRSTAAQHASSASQPVNLVNKQVLYSVCLSIIIRCGHLTGISLYWQRLQPASLSIISIYSGKHQVGFAHFQWLHNFTFRLFRICWGIYFLWLAIESNFNVLPMYWLVQGNHSNERCMKFARVARSLCKVKCGNMPMFLFSGASKRLRPISATGSANGRYWRRIACSISFTFYSLAWQFVVNLVSGTFLFAKIVRLVLN